MGFFFTINLLKCKLVDDFSLPKRDCISECLWLECVCVHSLNKDFCQAVNGTQCHFQKMVGWVAFKVFFLYVEV